ncbi:hypothetical protein [Puia sp.]|jgi:hypothetical protein|uniref:hypothetical protein n=1 Tax=Puia sp. TaxID=2045100 RepID=UPI002F3F7D69
MPVPYLISFLALAVSFYSLWTSRLKRGIVKMTRPPKIYLGPNGPGGPQKKVSVPMLLYCTAERGIYIQNMFVRLQRGESIQNFNLWQYEDHGPARGAGVFVNKRGLGTDHHFLIPNDYSQYEFLSGDYLLQVFVETVNMPPRKIFEQNLTIPNEQFQDMKRLNGGLYFHWSPGAQNYSCYVSAELP